jgi:hypothetical protein
MHKKIMAIGLLFVMALFNGCASGGNRPTSQIAASQTSQIIEGKSTMADVRGIMGEPINAYRSFRGEQTWHYLYSPELSVPGKVASEASECLPLGGIIRDILTDPGRTDCIISFDSQGIVKSVECR